MAKPPSLRIKFIIIMIKCWRERRYSSSAMVSVIGIAIGCKYVCNDRSRSEFGPDKDIQGRLMRK